MHIRRLPEGATTKRKKVLSFCRHAWFFTPPNTSKMINVAVKNLPLKIEFFLTTTILGILYFKIKTNSREYLLIKCINPDLQLGGCANHKTIFEWLHISAISCLWVT
uniref:Uncharacterized protein n=1 Tax=Pyxicephalus adspersus TaxID=30357 RepID=A0AAV2ZZ59_PYXAD|nr:TPA: hypothetical protein GDO54_015532 [Pyxicephalus adspersus]